MYKIVTGAMRHTLVGAKFDSVTEAMVFADNLYVVGFDYVAVVDERYKTEYTVEDRTPRTMEAREARTQAARDFRETWDKNYRKVNVNV
jgi:hypothetical protein